MAFTYLTGWRKSEPLPLLRANVNLKDGWAVTGAEDIKGGRTSGFHCIQLSLIYYEKSPGFSPEMCPWSRTHRGLDDDIERIQKAAGFELTCVGNHRGDCTESCKCYSFHDLRRGFGTITGGNLDSRRLQKTMRHKDFKTTQRYIDMRHQMNGIIDQIVVATLNPNPVYIAR